MKPRQHAIIGMTKTAAIERGAHGIRVNAAAPGPIAGRMTFKLADEVFAGSDKTFAETVPLGRRGTPEDVGPCLLLAVRRLQLRGRHDALGR
jgi:NAD(P)-dependent dehydrogenase (short-subunit alcohol dehydrogenase family)